MIEDFGNNIFMYKNVIGNNLNILQELEVIKRTYGQDYKDATMNEGRYDESIRSCKVFSLYAEKDLDPGYRNSKKILNRKIDIYLSKFILDFVSKTNIKIKEREPWEILRYEKEQSVTWHSDDGDPHPSKISFVYYINDDYLGGEIQFKDQFNSVPIKPDKDSLIIFPSSIEYIHRVLPVSEGTKYSVISFGK